MRQTQSQIQTKWARKNVSNGKCLRCVQIRLENSNLYCDKHYFQTVSKSVFGVVGKWEFLKTLIEKQNYKCALTGEDLILGLNASLDHIFPKSRIDNPNELSNLRWTTKQVNIVKNNLTDAELLELLEKIKNTIALNRQRSELSQA